LAQIQPSKQQFDVIVVGSGASGGWAAKRLAEAGIKVAMLEAGKPQGDANFTEHTPQYDVKYRDKAPEVIRRTRPRQKDCYACMEYNYHWFANDLEEPYTTAADKPFSWQGRMRVVGGRTNVWGRQSYRLSQQDLKGKSFDGYGEDWPLDYDDLVPYYEIVEDYVGIQGMAENVPELPDSKFQPGMAMSCAEMRLRTRVKEKLGRTITIGRSANITRPINGRSACHYCGPCERGCVTHSYFNSAFTTVADAVGTGKCTLITNAMVYQVLVDPASNRARGVLYIDRLTREPRELTARVVILCAQALESTRILLNSATREHPNGLGNGSDVIGRYLCEQIRVHVSGWLPQLYGQPAQSDRGIGGAHIYMPRFTHRREKLDFIRGFQMQFWNSGSQPSTLPGQARMLPGFGASLKRDIKRHYPAWVELHPFGETLPYAHNRITVDESKPDRYGLPMLKIDYQIGDNERKMADYMFDTLEEVGKAAGIEWAHFTRGELDSNGSAIHEHGCCRMGDDPKRSALDKFNRMHEVKNVFVVDGSSFTSASEKNPTLTILAISWRASDYLAEQIKRGELA